MATLPIEIDGLRPAIVSAQAIRPLMMHGPAWDPLTVRLVSGSGAMGLLLAPPLGPGLQAPLAIAVAPASGVLAMVVLIPMMSASVGSDLLPVRLPGVMLGRA